MIADIGVEMDLSRRGSACSDVGLLPPRVGEELARHRREHSDAFSGIQVWYDESRGSPSQLPLEPYHEAAQSERVYRHGSEKTLASPTLLRYQQAAAEAEAACTARSAHLKPGGGPGRGPGAGWSFGEALLQEAFPSKKDDFTKGGVASPAAAPCPSPSALPIAPAQQTFLASPETSRFRGLAAEALRGGLGLAATPPAPPSPAVRSPTARSPVGPRSPIEVGRGPVATHENPPDMALGEVVAGAARREAQAVEARLAGQLKRLSDQIGARGQKWEKQLDESQRKLMGADAVHTSLNRRVSEVAGGLKALSEETRDQTLRSSAADIRIWDFRREIEKECREKLDELQGEVRGALTKYSVKVEEFQRRADQQLKRVERLEIQGSASQDFDALQSRVLAVESLQRDAALAVRTRPDLDDQVKSLERVDCAERSIADLQRKLVEVNGESHDTIARLEEHVVRFNSFRDRMASQDQMHALDDRVRQCETKLDRAHRALQDVMDGQTEQLCRIEDLHARTERALAEQHQALERALHDLQERFDERCDELTEANNSLFLPLREEPQSSADIERLDAHVQDLQCRIEEIAAVAEAAGRDVASLALRVASLQEGLPPASALAAIPRAEHLDAKMVMLMEQAKALQQFQRQVAEQLEGLEGWQRAAGSRRLLPGAPPEAGERACVMGDR